MTVQHVYLNGKYIPSIEAKVSVFDRGFLFGDGVYDVLPVYNGKLFRLPQHLSRLRHSLENIHFNFTKEIKFEKIFQGLLECNEVTPFTNIYLQVTRGTDNKRDHAIPDHLEPTIFACILPPIQQSDATTKKQGIKAVTVADNRWARCDIKAITLLANVLAKQNALNVGAAEAIFIRENHAIEGSASNLFIVKDNTIITPPQSELLLAGITRDVVIDLAQQQNLPLEQRSILAQELPQADEIWLTSSTKEIMAVVSLDDKPVNEGTTGPLWEKLNHAFQQATK